MSQIKILISTIIFLMVFKGSFSQYTTSGPLSGTVFSDDNSIGSFPFSIPGNAVTSDNNRSSANALAILLNGNTHYLKVTGFGFSIPAVASITGIRIEVEKSAWDISILATVRDNQVRLIKGGSIVGDNKASGASWDDSDDYSIYGDTTDDWGESWTPANVNSPDFGVAFSARINGLLSLIPTARVDHIRVTVFYIVPLPIHFIDFTATKKENDVLLKWTMGDNDERVSFCVQRSNNSTNWIDVQTVQGGVSINNKSYEYVDHPPANDDRFYYRIKMIKRSGLVAYSKIVYTDVTSTSYINIYPNPAGNHVLISHAGSNKVELLSITGQKMNVHIEKLSDTRLRINTSFLRRGLYIIQSGGKRERLLIQ